MYNGYWFSPEMQFLQVAMDHAQEHVTGSVDLRLLKGNVICRGRSSAQSLYNEAMVSMDVEGGFNPEISTGFVQTLSTRPRSSSQPGYVHSTTAPASITRSSIGLGETADAISTNRS